ncbi:hypothetical protein POPTR_006G080001v4 [Populus trichocarpa]|uniref:Uncharacterized protein n=3 Tax=Populus trichocarpa TaxID=3694 RepID=A0ACC0SSZ2_POPTR|nr:hypothetical protein BDE02_06G069700 [Populus trichocarpa]KAI9392360.1 hypothetical protein POPTR_006G080001v4 [Populus trichocarpa]KAI9392361.1 hypothetical protein POPTR_006G080001v4 [Populus trichocarpa]KAI9392362.1 hypothetical protein POPTR_006G080001v4 [Populus trichocarpa]
MHPLLSSCISSQALSLTNGRQQMNAVLNRVPFLEANSTWQSNCSFKVTHSGDFFIRPAKAGGIRWQLN